MENHYSVSPNLIDQVQILLKKEAGFESLNFNDHSLDSPPSLFFDEAVAGLNSCSDALRCKNCIGELLRGSASIICVYCGHAQQQDFLPQPISFRNTFAFQWFLKSLDLDGFESVGIPVRDNQFGDRGRSSVKEEEVALSDFLDLELKWSYDLGGFGVETKERLPGKSYLNLVGVDIEEILGQESIDHGFSVRNEQAVVSPKFGIEESGISGEKSLSLFENTQSTEAASRSGEGENDESFSDWGAEFQSAIPESGHEKSANSLICDPQSGSNLTTSSNNLWSNFESGPPFNTKVSDGNILVDGGGKATELADASFYGLPADQRPATLDDSPNIENRDGNDTFGDWGDFRMSMNDNLTQSKPSSTAVPGTDGSGGLVTSDPFDDFTGFVVSKDIQLPNDSFRGPADAWNNFTTPSTGGDIRSQIISDKTEEHVGTGDSTLDGENVLAPLDVTYFEHQVINVERTQNKISDLGDSIGSWNNDIYLGIIGELDQSQCRESKSPASGTTNNLDNSFDLWNDFKGSDNQQQATNKEEADYKISIEDVSTFDAWNDFAGPGVREKEQHASSLEVADRKGNGDQSESLAVWNDNSLDAWSDFAGSSGVFDSKPISNDISSVAWNHFSSIIASHANQPQSSNTRTSENQAVLEDDNLFSSWSDFRSSGTHTGNSYLRLSDNKTSSDQISFQKNCNSLKKVEDSSTFSSWGDFGGATSNLEQQLQAAGAGSSAYILSNGDGDLFSGFSNGGKQFTSKTDNQLHCDGVTTHNGESTRENDNSFGAWSDFTSSSNVQANYSSSANAPDDKEAVNHGDLFDVCNVIVSSSNVEAGKDTAVTMVITPELKYLSPDMNVGPNSSMPLDLNVGMFNHQNGSAPVAFSPPEGPDLVRTEHGDVKADGYVNGMNPSESTSKEALDLKSSAAETLISEMHDLSFILESSLSIPNSGR